MVIEMGDNDIFHHCVIFVHHHQFGW